RVSGVVRWAAGRCVVAAGRCTLGAAAAFWTVAVFGAVAAFWGAVAGLAGAGFFAAGSADVPRRISGVIDPAGLVWAALEPAKASKAARLTT
ncbi:MAG: hypothetical protein K2Y40_11835, partial [Reyranella sp.]|nr:hypothetical protein [Reyranella sp.]